MITAATRSTLHENVLKQLCAAIESGQWEPGSRLPGELVASSQGEPNAYVKL
jgi:DNA-binding FadR family transcriptional regulator